MKNAFIIIIILAIVAGGLVGLYFSKIKKTNAPMVANTATGTVSGSGISNAGDVLKQLNDFAK